MESSSFAVQQMFQLQQNASFLARARTLIDGAAQFWASRATQTLPSLRRDGDGKALASQYSINGVQPPDEYHVPVNNSFYTNTGLDAFLRECAE